MFSVRSALIILGALVFGVLAGWLSFVDSQSLVKAVLFAAGAFGGAIVLLHTIIDR